MSPVPGCGEAVARVEFEITGADVTEIRNRADLTLGEFADGHPYLFDVAAYPAVATAAGQIVQWRADITASIYPQEPTR